MDQTADHDPGHGETDISVKHGDYILATKYTDGNPQDPWAIGFLDGMWRNRFTVVDNEGKRFVGNCFMRVDLVSLGCGAWMIKNSKLIEQCSISVWGVRRLWKRLSVDWMDLVAKP